MVTRSRAEAGEAAADRADGAGQVDQPLWCYPPRAARTPSVATTAGGACLFAGRPGRVAGVLRLAGETGGSPPSRLGWLAALGPSCRHSLVPATTPGGAASPGSWPGSMDFSLFVDAPSAVSPIAGWDFGTHARLTGMCRIIQAAPCSPTVRQLNRQTARAATRRAIGSQQQLPRAASGPSLWPSTHGRSFSCCPCSSHP